MKLTDKGDIVFSLQDFVEHMDDETKKDLIIVLSCQDSVIKNVADQIMDGMTDQGSCGSLCCTAHAEPLFGLDYSKRK